MYSISFHQNFIENLSRLPRAIEWEDGRVFAIDRVLDVRRAASLKAGGVGMRYICRIRGKTVKLFNEENKWFMEGQAD